MKLFGINIKREYILYYMEPEDKLWFYDEPFANKKSMDKRLQYLRERNSKIKIKTRYTIEV